MTVPLDQLDYEALRSVMNAEASHYADLAALGEWMRTASRLVDDIDDDATANLRQLPDAINGAAATALHTQIEGDLQSLRAVVDDADLYRLGTDIQRLASAIYSVDVHLERIGTIPHLGSLSIWPLSLALKSYLDNEARAVVRTLPELYRGVIDGLRTLAAAPMPSEAPHS